MYPLAGYKQWAGRSVGSLGRKSGAVVQEKSVVVHSPGVEALLNGRKGRVPAENWGKCLTQHRDSLSCLNVRSGCDEAVVLKTVLSVFVTV